MRGKARFTGTPKTAEVIRKGGKWYLSVTYDVTPEAVARPAGSDAAAFDWGLDTLLTIAKPDGAIETIDNPRWLKARLEHIKIVSRSISAEETKIRDALGVAADAPIHPAQRSAKLNRLRLLTLVEN